MFFNKTKLKLEAEIKVLQDKLQEEQEKTLEIENSIKPAALLISNFLHHGEKLVKDYRGAVLSKGKRDFLHAIGTLMRLMSGLYGRTQFIPVVSLQAKHEELSSMKFVIDQFNLIGSSFSELFMIAEKVLLGDDPTVAITKMRDAWENDREIELCITVRDDRDGRLINLLNK